jgi:CheY-like chemotaxis protein
MDIQMPRMNGYEATEKLRESGFSMPIIAVTASALADERERCRTAGMDDILVKPYKRDDIDLMIRKWRRASHPQQGNRSPETGELEEIGDLEAVEDGPAAEEPAIRESELLDNFLGKKDVVYPLLEKFILGPGSRSVPRLGPGRRGLGSPPQGDAHDQGQLAQPRGEGIGRRGSPRRNRGEEPRRNRLQDRSGGVDPRVSPLRESGAIHHRFLRSRHETRLPPHPYGLLRRKRYGFGHVPGGLRKRTLRDRLSVPTRRFPSGPLGT